MSIDEKKVFNVLEFCEAYDISRSMFYKLKKQNLIPSVFRVGKRVLISKESAEKWAQEMESITK